MEQFNQLCYDFQNKILDVFNEEQNIPFLLKYYLFKEIWENVEQAVTRDKMTLHSIGQENHKEEDTEEE